MDFSQVMKIINLKTQEITRKTLKILSKITEKE